MDFDAVDGRRPVDLVWFFLCILAFLASALIGVGGGFLFLLDMTLLGLKK